VLTGISLHIITHETIPWESMDLNRSKIKADKEFHITMENHEFKLPSLKLLIVKNETVRFNVDSKDLTYGFGLFRNDNTMFFLDTGNSCHVMTFFGSSTGRRFIPFDQPNTGPKGINMIVRDAVEVID